jgi:hypothetical protein
MVGQAGQGAIIMEAKAKSFTFLSNEGTVSIPFFQRMYIWDGSEVLKSIGTAVRIN